MKRLYLGFMRKKEKIYLFLLTKTPNDYIIIMHTHMFIKFNKTGKRKCFHLVDKHIYSII